MTAPTYVVKGVNRNQYTFIGTKAGKPRTTMVVTTKGKSDSHVKSR